MSIPFIVLSLLAGWCGTEPVVLPPLVVVPKPRPICPACIAVAALGGLGLAALVTRNFSVETSVLSVAALGYIGGRTVSDLFNGYFKK